MINFTNLTPILIVLVEVVLALLSVAYVTVAERKTMASMQRRLGPNTVGFWGSLQAFADALKLLLKEYVSPTQANLILFFLGPIITLVFSLLGYGVIPYGPGLTIWDFDLGILYMLAVSSLATYGILLAGWSANSKYAFLGALRSTAQLISYELILSSAILLVILLTGSLSLTVNTEFQRIIWFTLPLLPIFIIFFIGSVAETNRPPFDLAEAESELVSGFMTEHAAVIFVFFFLAEYGSILLICMLNSILFLGGYLYSNIIFSELIINIYDNIENTILNPDLTEFSLDLTHYPLLEGLLYGNSLGVKTCIMVFTFIWVRASFPRIRYDQLMTYSWTMLLPIVIAFIILVPCNIFDFEIVVTNFSMLFFWPFKLNNKSKAKWVSIILTGVISTAMFIIIRSNLITLCDLDLLDFDSDWGIKTLIIFLLYLIKGLIKLGTDGFVETDKVKQLLGPSKTFNLNILDKLRMLDGPEMCDGSKIDKLKKNNICLKSPSDVSTSEGTPNDTASSDESMGNYTPEGTPGATPSSDVSMGNDTPEGTPSSDEYMGNDTPEGTPSCDEQNPVDSDNESSYDSDNESSYDSDDTVQHVCELTDEQYNTVEVRFLMGVHDTTGLNTAQRGLLQHFINTYGTADGNQNVDPSQFEADSNSSDNEANSSDNEANSSNNAPSSSDNGANISDNKSNSE